jgi:hypothetical protein
MIWNSNFVVPESDKDFSEYMENFKLDGNTDDLAIRFSKNGKFRIAGIA